MELLIPVVGAAVGLIVWFVRSWVESIHRARERLHDERRRIYLDLLEPHIRILASRESKKQLAEVTEFVQSYEYKRTAVEFNLVGSDNVVRAFNDMMQFFYHVDASKESTSPKEFIKHWGGLLLEIRKNVGEPGTKLSERDMLRALIKDIDSIV